MFTPCAHSKNWEEWRISASKLKQKTQDRTERATLASPSQGTHLPGWTTRTPSHIRRRMARSMCVHWWDRAIQCQAPPYKTHETQTKNKAKCDLKNLLRCKAWSPMKSGLKSHQDVKSMVSKIAITKIVISKIMKSKITMILYFSTHEHRF